MFYGTMHNKIVCPPTLVRASVWILDNDVHLSHFKPRLILLIFVCIYKVTFNITHHLQSNIQYHSSSTKLHSISRIIYKVTFNITYSGRQATNEILNLLMNSCKSGHFPAFYFCIVILQLFDFVLLIHYTDWKNYAYSQVMCMYSLGLWCFDLKKTHILLLLDNIIKGFWVCMV